MSLKRSSEIQGGGTFFKPKDHADAFVLIVEPKTVRRDVPFTPYQKQHVEHRDEVVADVTAFASAADLANGKAVEYQGLTITHPGLVNKLSHGVGEAIVGRMGQKVFKAGSNPAWVLDDEVIDDESFAQAVAYYDAREAAVAEAKANVPSFD